MPRQVYGSGAKAIVGYVTGNFTKIQDYPYWQGRDTAENGVMIFYGYKNMSHVRDLRQCPTLLTASQFQELVDWVVEQGRRVECL